MDKFSLTLIIIGAINWLLVSLAQFDLVAWIFGGTGTVWSRIVYGIIGICGIWCIKMLFQPERERRPKPARSNV